MLVSTVRGTEMFNNVGVVARPDRKEALKLGTKLLEHLESRGLKVSLEPELAEYAEKPDLAAPLERMKVDLIVTIGGDGTILRTCLLIPKPEPPILAVNMGVRGFLTEVEPRDGIEAVDQCLEGKFVLERCRKLTSFAGETKLPDALNEVFITSRALAKVLYTRIRKDEELVAECRSDGIVVASQVGATGYSLSGGGPILDPKLDAFVLTPILPLSPFHPIVFPAKSSVSIQLLKPKSATVVVDGHHRIEIGPKKPRVTVTKSEYESSFVRFKGDFYRRLRKRGFSPCPVI